MLDWASKLVVFVCFLGFGLASFLSSLRTLSQKKILIVINKKETESTKVSTLNQPKSAILLFLDGTRNQKNTFKFALSWHYHLPPFFERPIPPLSFSPLTFLLHLSSLFVSSFPPDPRFAPKKERKRRNIPLSPQKKVNK